MTYSAHDARNDLHADSRAQEVRDNYALIQQTTRGGGRWTYVNFGYNGAQAMKQIMESAGYRAEVTHDGHGVRVSW